MNTEHMEFITSNLSKRIFWRAIILSTIFSPALALTSPSLSLAASSANYSVPAGTIVTTGNQAQSANYTAAASVVLMTGSGSSTSFVARLACDCYL